MTTIDKAITPELMPPEKSNSQSIGFLDSNPNLKSISNLNPSEKVVQYHLAAERCANLSVWCAAMAGAEILAKKKELGHGNGFVEWREALPFSASTAKNYVNLALQLEQRLNALPAERRALMLPAVADAQAQAANMLQLLNLPSPMDVFNPAHEQIAEIIRDVTSGKTITQLYFDWEICKPPRQLGGNPALQKWMNEFHPRIHATRPEELSPKLQKEFAAWLEEQNAEAAKGLGANGESVHAETALAVWSEARKALYEFVRARKLYAYLNAPEIEQIADTLTDYAREMKLSIRKG